MLICTFVLNFEIPCIGQKIQELPTTAASFIQKLSIIITYDIGGCSIRYPYIDPFYVLPLLFSLFFVV